LVARAVLGGGREPWVELISSVMHGNDSFGETSPVNHPASLIDPAPRTFSGVPSVRNLDVLDAQVAFLGVPYDGGTPQPGIPTGQRAGPAAAREATEAQFYYPRLPDGGDDPGAEGWYDVEADRD
jgi:hypothetical protein